MNKNISVWRGEQPPPTTKHLWIKPDNKLYINVNDTWMLLAVNHYGLENLIGNDKNMTVREIAADEIKDYLKWRDI